ncbi:MAG: T9SS type A sorting domain-containing protein [Bacteroidales bacterium]
MGLSAFDTNGNEVWRKFYGQEDEQVAIEELRYIERLSNNNILLTASCYVAPKGTYDGYLKAETIILNSDGEIICTKILHKNNFDQYDGIIHRRGIAHPSIDGKYIYRSFGRSYQSGKYSGYDVPSMAKFDLQGDHIEYTDFLEPKETAIIGDFEFVDENRFIGELLYRDLEEEEKERFEESVTFTFAALFDMKKGLLKSYPLFRSGVNYCVCKTSDNHYFFSASNYSEEENYPDGFAILKFTSELELAAEDKENINYDYLCDHSIQSETLFINEFLTTGIEESKEKGVLNLEIFPNPTSRNLEIILPDFIEINEKTALSHVLHQQVQYQQESRIDILNIKGQLVHSVKLNEGQGQVKLNVSNYENGIYLTRLIYKNQIVGGQKWIKN